MGLHLFYNDSDTFLLNSKGKYIYLLVVRSWFTLGLIPHSVCLYAIPPKAEACDLYINIRSIAFHQWILPPYYTFLFLVHSSVAFPTQAMAFRLRG